MKSLILILLLLSISTVVYAAFGGSRFGEQSVSGGVVIPSVEDVRVTTDGNVRITTDGNIRIIP